ncbi:MAG: hypothetical protein OEV92_08025 [Nitrospinota bacterium]|nr:hypothetical protein [Nitrospinota bacterium]
METVTGMMAALAALSISVERVVEIIKNVVPWLFAENKDAIREKRRKAMLQALSALVGAAIAYSSADLIRQTMPALFANRQIGVLDCLIIGLLASGGSGFWNHGLSIVEGIKKAKELDIKSRKKGQES